MLFERSFRVPLSETFDVYYYCAGAAEYDSDIADYTWIELSVDVAAVYTGKGKLYTWILVEMLFMGSL